MLKNKSNFNSCIVLDIDETLVHTKQTLNSPNDKLKKNSDIHFKLHEVYYYIDIRPHALQFLKKVFENFDHVCIWTAAEKVYAKKIISKIMTPYQEGSLLEFWSRKNCVIDKDGNYTKPLEKLFQKYKFLKPTNTILVDNNRVITNLNKPMSIKVPDFIGNKNDTVLLKLTPSKNINSQRILGLYKNKLK